jgi:hypothetical protein
MHAKNDYTGARRLFQESLCGFNAVQEWHAYVHNHNVGQQRGRKRNSLSAILGFTNYFKVSLTLEQRPETGAH